VVWLWDWDGNGAVTHRGWSRVKNGQSSVFFLSKFHLAVGISFVGVLYLIVGVLKVLKKYIPLLDLIQNGISNV
jgi:hypothetical protein